MTFVLSSSGRIHSIVNPPSSPKAKFYLRSELQARREAVAGLGSKTRPAGDPAPGRYVHQS